MSTYLLLRDNKQSGPYTLDEIIAKGFKKYDLVWVDKKSAAWRYPGEIAELKSFAPIIEEQPFDRFFKKPIEEIHSKSVSKSSALKVEVVQSAVLPQVTLETVNKRVYAALPVKKPLGIQAEEKNVSKQTPKEQIKSEEPKPLANGFFLKAQESALQPQSSVEQFQKINIFHSGLNQYGRFLQPALLALCVAALLCAGIFIGLSISKDKPTATLKRNANKTTVASVDNQKKSNFPIAIPSSHEIGKPANVNDKEINSDDLQTKNTSIPNKKTSLLNEKKKNIAFKEANANSTSLLTLKQEVKSDNISSYPIVPRREATHRDDAIGAKDLNKSNIVNLVSVSPNKYHVGTFGGISEVQLTVNNRSVYSLDLVMVVVQYVQANKKIFKTENVYFRNIGPGASMMMEAPESSRGIKVQCKVSTVNSKDVSISYSGN